jgi:hypothetical protein
MEGSKIKAYKKYDLVHIAKNLGSSMDHFGNDIDAIVLEGDGSYELYLKGRGPCAWYKHNQLTLLEHNRKDLLEQWENEANNLEKIQSNIDWIFENGPTFEKGIPRTCVETLARYLGITNMWGSHGEGFVWYQNAFMTFTIAKPFLMNKDKQGYIEAATKFNSEYEKSVNNA